MSKVSAKMMPRNIRKAKVGEKKFDETIEKDFEKQNLLNKVITIDDNWFF
jgi:hypothetical protein